MRRSALLAVTLTLTGAAPLTSPPAAPAPHAETIPRDEAVVAAGGVREVLIEALVATVNQEVITLGEIEAEARIVLIRRGGSLGASRPIDDGLRAAVLQYLINQEIILAEARRLQLFQVSDAEIDAELERIAHLFVSEEAYGEFLHQSGLTDSDISEIVRRDLRVSKFLRSRIEMIARLDPQEVRAYYAEHPDRFGSRPLQEVRPEIEAEVGRIRHEEAIRSWVSTLKDRSDIRILRSFQGSSPAP